MDRNTAVALRGGEVAATDDASPVAGLTSALRRYFDLMYDCDTSRYDNVFLKTAHLHGHRDGAMVAWSGDVYRAILDKRQSPLSLGSLRHDEILLVDLASDDMAFVKVRLRINASVFVDDLIWHRIGSDWRISAKGFHLESEDAT